MWRKFSLEGFGDVLYEPVKVVEQELENCTPSGELVVRETVGERAKTIYKTADGKVISSASVCKKMIVDGEEIVVSKFKPISRVDKEDYSFTDDPGVVHNGAIRNFYKVKTDSKDLKAMLKEKKIISFPFTAGLGHKAWVACLMDWNGQPIMATIRGNVSKLLEQSKDDAIEVEIEAIPNEIQNKKKFLKAVLEV